MGVGAVVIIQRKKKRESKTFRAECQNLLQDALKDIDPLTGKLLKLPVLKLEGDKVKRLRVPGSAK